MQSVHFHICPYLCIYRYMLICLYISKTTCPIFTNFFVHVTTGRGNNTIRLCTYGFVDDAIFSHNGTHIDN